MMTQAIDKTRPTTPANKLEYAIHLAKSGRKEEARELLRRLVALQPVNQTAWLWLSGLAADKAEAEAALARARKINPAHPRLPQAEQWVAHHFSDQQTTRPAPAVDLPAKTAPLDAPGQSGFLTHKVLVLVILGGLVGLILLFLGLGWQLTVAAESEQVNQKRDPTADYLAAAEAARKQQNWTQAITILEALHQARPESSAIAEQLTRAYTQKGLALRRKGFFEEAIPFFNKALAVTPGQPQARQEVDLASTYLAGTEYYQAGRWEEAIAALEQIQVEARDYLHLRDLLYSAYYNHGLALRAADQLLEARDAFEAALSLRPDLSDPRRQLAEIEFALAPQTPLEKPLTSPLAKDQLVVVGVAEQRMLVFERDQQVFDFVVSTGEPGRDTAIGEFEILNKIDMAYASTWNLDMPYWLGIYWSGPLQNGIHALPIVKHTGYKLWDGYLGQRVSYGCVILSDEDAATLYDWIEIGAEVKIVPSLAGWLGEQ